jgi:hypothetical protein
MCVRSPSPERRTLYVQPSTREVITLREWRENARPKNGNICLKASNLVTKVAQNGPRFGGGSDIRIVDACNAYTGSYSSFGDTYVNDTGANGQEIFTGAHYFKVQEIEIFELSDLITYQAISTVFSNEISGQQKVDAGEGFLPHQSSNSHEFRSSARRKLIGDCFRADHSL